MVFVSWTVGLKRRSTKKRDKISDFQNIWSWLCHKTTKQMISIRIATNCGRSYRRRKWLKNEGYALVVRFVPDKISWIFYFYFLLWNLFNVLLVLLPMLPNINLQSLPGSTKRNMNKNGFKTFEFLQHHDYDKTINQRLPKFLWHMAKSSSRNIRKW